MTTTINYLTEYIPTRFSATSKQISDRQMVWRFKDGIYDNDVMGKYASIINQAAGPNSIVCFIPASSNSRTLQRFERLSDYISSHCPVRASVNYKAELTLLCQDISTVSQVIRLLLLLWIPLWRVKMLSL